MYTREALLDMNRRVHWNARDIIAWLGTLGAALLLREVPGFSYPTLRGQVHHALGAQEYWLGVVEGRSDYEEHEERYVSAADLEAYRQHCEQLVVRVIEERSDQRLNAPVAMTLFNGSTHDLSPAHVILRTLTHWYQHQGEIMSMLRLLDVRKPEGSDFPIRPRLPA